ncbi:uncharacterized protein C8A04DRAFT_35975 [Dichotomopilus funicola]|uniref:Impact N-terminal domain-containing protein n=1 Tax=Dichotomopilus funicola TaxID=1934379 RepID=A0AAN6V820_9PEZI|nr:hypothetical protein C8A04DRAFT_35975 [Dichotomopilus funicola]
MSAQQDLQELLRLITIVRKTPMLQAMGQVKALQTADLKSIKQIAEAPLETVQAALKDDKAARPLHNACKAALKRAASTTSTKRGAPDSTATVTSPKRTKTTTNPFMPRSAELTPQEFEASLELPLCLDEERIANTVIETNRAPLVLAFAVEALRHTMPDQPLSSRLSLGQAVVSANSRSKAVSLGLNRGPSAEEEGWGEGQPRVKVLGREVAVLKRGGYEWRESATTTTATDTATTGEGQGGEGSAAETRTVTSPQVKTEQHITTPTSNNPLTITAHKPTWSTSQPITLKDSTFIARATTITDPSQRKALIDALLHDIPHLQTASHNAWAYRICPPRANFFTPSSGSGSTSTRIREDSFDDGETGSGNLILRILREHGAGDNTLVVLTRWFGGTMLGPDRWRLMQDCVSGALAERLRKTGDEVVVNRGEALWGLDLEDARRKNAQVVGMPVHRPEGARGYLLRSFGRGVVKVGGEGEAEAEEKSTKKPKVKTIKETEAEKEENLGLLLGALRLVFDSWAGHISAVELDRRAWSWYVAVRPDVESGQAGWGAKGKLKLSDVLKLRRYKDSNSY